MKRRIGGWLAAIALCAAVGVAVNAAPETAKMDQPVKDFQMKDVMQDEESMIKLSQFKGKKTVVLTFVSYNCDMTWRYEKRIGKLLQDYGKKDVAFLAIRSNARDTADGIRKYAEAKNLTMPVLYDDKNVVADYYGAQVTPTFYVIDKEGVLRYGGSFDENPDEKVAQKTFVRDALDAVLAGKAVSVKKTDAFG